MCYVAEASQVGLEPTTHRLTADCSTIELLRNMFALTNTTLSVLANKNLVGKMGVEPMTPRL